MNNTPNNFSNDNNTNLIGNNYQNPNLPNSVNNEPTATKKNDIVDSQDDMRISIVENNEPKENSLIRSPYQPNHFINQNCVTHIVRKLNPSESFNTSSFAKVRCDNITTMWVDSIGFSYLTTTANDQNYFFLPQKEKGFDLEGWDDSNTNYKINRNQISNFVGEINNVFNNGNHVEEATLKYKRSFKKCLSLFIVSMLIFIVSFLFFLLKKFPRFKTLFIIVFPISLFLSCIFLSFLLIYYFSNAFKIYERTKAILTHTTDVERILNNWNFQVFLPCGLYVIIPRNLAYIQFVLHSNIRFLMEDHSYPYDPIKKRFFRIHRRSNNMNI